MDEPQDIPVSAGAAPEASEAGFFRWSDAVTAGHRAVRLSDGREVPSVRFGDHDLIGLLGSGGMARVYLARDPNTGRELALKVLSAEASRDSARRAMFRDEARLGRLLSHRHVVRLLDVGAVGGRPYLVLERVRGWDLGCIVRELGARGVRLTEPIIAALGLRVARALAYAHGLTDERGRHLGLVHRDLKPGNVMVGEDGAVKVLDFGVATFADREASTGEGWVKGTAPYLSPEQVLGYPLSGRSDVFAFGSLLVALGLGRSPFARPTLEAVGAAVVSADLSDEWGAISQALPRLAGLVLDCCQPVAAERPSAIDLVAALEAHTPHDDEAALAAWIGEVGPTLWPYPEAGDWPDGVPEGMRKTQVEQGLTPR